MLKSSLYQLLQMDGIAYWRGYILIFSSCLYLWYIGENQTCTKNMRQRSLPRYLIHFFYYQPRRPATTHYYIIPPMHFISNRPTSKIFFSPFPSDQKNQKVFF